VSEHKVVKVVVASMAMWYDCWGGKESVVTRGWLRERSAGHQAEGNKVSTGRSYCGRPRTDWDLLELAGRGNNMLLQLVVAFESPLSRLFGGLTVAWKVETSEIASQTLLANEANQRMPVPEASHFTI
jgi:hypothetical protein